MVGSKSERAWHRTMGARCFNRAWSYLGKRRRTADDDRRMLDLVHASRFHWGLVGDARHRAVADWQVSRAYAALSQPTLALAYSRSALALCEKHRLADLLCTAYEGMARAYGAARQMRRAGSYLRRALAQLEVAPVDREDRKVYLRQIRETERGIHAVRR